MGHTHYRARTGQRSRSRGSNLNQTLELSLSASCIIASVDVGLGLLGCCHAWPLGCPEPPRRCTWSDPIDADHPHDPHTGPDASQGHRDHAPAVRLGLSNPASGPTPFPEGRVSSSQVNMQPQQQRRLRLGRPLVPLVLTAAWVLLLAWTPSVRGAAASASSSPLSSPSASRPTRKGGLLYGESRRTDGPP